MGVLEVVKAFSEPTIKLMDMVGSAIGTAYEPRHKRKMADATAYEISVVGNAMRNAADLPVLYNQEGVVINSDDFNRLMQRAGTRLALQETIKQHNIESVLDNAYAILEKENHCSSEPVEQGWINRFFDSVADVSDEDLQKLWGKILAEEIISPKSFNLRTLDTIKNLTKSEASLFHRFSKYALSIYDEDSDIISFFVISNMFNASQNKYVDINYGEILKLQDAGLISLHSGTRYDLTFECGEIDTVYCNNKDIQIANNTSSLANIIFQPYILTMAGKELLNIINNKNDPPLSYLNACCETLDQLTKPTRNSLDIIIT